MRSVGFAVLICCVLAIDFVGAQRPKVFDGSSLALSASTSLGRLHVDLRKAVNGPLHVRVGYGDGSGRYCADAISLSLSSSTEEV